MSRYWYHDYYPPANPKAVKNGIKTKKKRGSIGETWWSKKWIAVLESFDMGARLGRGRSYARRGQVISIDVDAGIVCASVQGSGSRPYEVEIKLKPLNEKQWESVVDIMASKAVYVAKLLDGNMPPNIEEAFEEVNISLFPGRKRDLKTDCSCPDWANPCKHIAAVYYLLAERFDDDPFLIFKLRGLDKEGLMEKMKDRRKGFAVEQVVDESFIPVVSETEMLKKFWSLDKGVSDFETKLTTADPEALLKRLGKAPFEVRGKNLSDVLAVIYEDAGQRVRDMD